MSKQMFNEYELQVLAYLSIGYTNGKIAEKLFVSEDTIKNLVHHIYLRLEIDDKTETYSKAMINGSVHL